MTTDKPCRRAGCGHLRHMHLVSSTGACQVQGVRPVDMGVIAVNAAKLSTADQHPGCEVTPCECQGYLG